MPNPNTSFARIHLLPAKEAPYVVVIRRKPSKQVHIMRWNTQTDEIEHGSWFSGRIYEMRSDVSFDGQWMVYLAMGSKGNTWVGICQPPYLKTVVDWENCGSWHGGGYFEKNRLLRLNAGYALSAMEKALAAIPKKLPFKTAEIDYKYGGEDENVLYQRLERDGFKYSGERELPDMSYYGKPYHFLGNRQEKENGYYWTIQPTPHHPVLRVTYVGYYEKRGRVFHFDLPDYPELLGFGVTWATYDCLGQLIVAREGAIERYTLENIKSGVPRFRLDLEDMVPPEKKTKPERDLDWFPLEEPFTPIKFVTDALTDMEVKTIVIPIASTPRANAVRELAGEFLINELKDLTDARLPFATSAYYLRHNDIIHDPEPSATSDRDVLESCSRMVFDLAGERGAVSVGLHPIGLAAGWDWETAIRATIKAAREFIAEEEGRWVRIVVDDEEQATAAQVILDE